MRDKEFDTWGVRAYLRWLCNLLHAYGIGGCAIRCPPGLLETGLLKQVIEASTAHPQEPSGLRPVAVGSPQRFYRVADPQPLHRRLEMEGFIGNGGSRHVSNVALDPRREVLRKQQLAVLRWG